MKEYKTLRVQPEQENAMIAEMESFGWKLEESREVYNESQELVGVHENSKTTVYGNGFIGGFMKGFTCNDGKVESQVTFETKKNVTHFLSMRFSRDQSLKNYDRLVNLENEFYRMPQRGEYVKLSKKPVAQTFALIVIAFILIFQSIMAKAIVPIICTCLVAIAIIVLLWVVYSKKHKKQVEQNDKTQAENEKIIQAHRAKQKEIRIEVDEILQENGLL